MRWTLAAVYAVLFTILGAWRYAVHRNFVDFGIFSQTVASAFGCFCNQMEGSHWAFHFSPILYIVGALVALWHSPLVLITSQAVACALVIPPVYAIVSRRADAKRAAMAAIVTALYPALAGLTFGDFHENGFAPAAVAWMLWAFDADRLGLACLFAALTLCIKEDQGIFLAIAGAVGAWRYRGTARGRVAAGIGVAGIAVLAMFFLVIQPHAVARAHHWAPTRFYAWTSGDVSNLPLGLVQRLGFVVLAFAPLAFVPFRSPYMLLAAAPLLEVLASRMATTYTMGTHYTGAWAGYVLAAFAFAVRALPERSATRTLYASLVLCIIELAVANPMHPGMNLRPIQARDVALDGFLKTLPRDMPVATQEEAYTHLALGNPNARLLPESPAVVPDDCFALVDHAYPQSVILLEYGSAFDALVHNRTYVAIARDGDAVLYRRATCAPR